MLLAHLCVSKFSPAIMKAILLDWRLFRDCVEAPLFAVPPNETVSGSCATEQEAEMSKWSRFVRLLGFKPLNQIVVWEGKPRPMYLHHKDFHEHYPDSNN